MSSFEDLQVWQRSKDVAVEVIKLIGHSRNYGLRDQMTRSALSVPSNIAEGAERKGKKEFANFLSYASGSAAELITQLMISTELGEITEVTAAKLITESREISKMLYALRNSLED